MYINVSKLSAFFISIFSFAQISYAQSSFNRFELDAAHSAVKFEISHLVVATVDGRFDKFSGTFEYDEQSQTLKNVEVDIDASSINTNEPKRDNHLKSEDFFDVKRFPKITFENVSLVSSGGKPQKVLGTFKMHGVEKNISLDVDYKGPVEDAWGNKKIVFNLNGTIKRSDFGLTWNKKLDKGGVLIGDEVKIIINAQAAPKK